MSDDILFNASLSTFISRLSFEISSFNEVDFFSTSETSLAILSSSSFNLSDISIDFCVSKLVKSTVLNFSISRLYWAVNNDFLSFKVSSSTLTGLSWLFKSDNSFFLLSIKAVFFWNFSSNSAILEFTALSATTSLPSYDKIEPV